jgi:hypothetical protein
MKSSLKNFALLAAVLVLSYFTAPYIGLWYDKFSPQYGSWIVGRNDAIFFAGMMISYVFFVPFIYGLFGIKKNKKWITWLLLPAILLWLSSDKYYFYIAVIFVAVALFLTKLINLIISKFRHPNPPMVIK